MADPSGCGPMRAGPPPSRCAAHGARVASVRGRPRPIHRPSPARRGRPARRDRCPLAWRCPRRRWLPAGLVAEASIPVDGALVEAAALLHDIDKVEIRAHAGASTASSARGGSRRWAMRSSPMPVASHPITCAARRRSLSDRLAVGPGRGRRPARGPGVHDRRRAPGRHAATPSRVRGGHRVGAASRACPRRAARRGDRALGR